MTTGRHVTSLRSLAFLAFRGASRSNLRERRRMRRSRLASRDDLAFHSGHSGTRERAEKLVRVRRATWRVSFQVMSSRAPFRDRSSARRSAPLARDFVVAFHRRRPAATWRREISSASRGDFFPRPFSKLRGIYRAWRFAYSCLLRSGFSRALDSRSDAADFRWRQAHVDDRSGGDPDQSVIGVFLVRCPHSRALFVHVEDPSPSWFSRGSGLWSRRHGGLGRLLR